MKAISLHQPWASFVVWGLKTCETRSWVTYYRGTLLIHATKRVDRGGQQVWDEFTAKFPDHARLIGASFKDLPRGCLMGAVELTSTAPVLEALETLDLEFLAKEMPFGNWDPGRWIWRLECPYRLPNPKPCRGMQALWDCALPGVIPSLFPLSTNSL